MLVEKLMPKSEAFFVDFEEQVAVVLEGIRLFRDLLEDLSDARRKCAAIKDIEHRADDITHRSFDRLHSQYITPFDRTEIHRLLSRVDDVLDLADAAAARLGLYEIETAIPEARELAAVLVSQAERMAEAIRMLRSVRANSGAILAACRDINALENQADTITRRTMAKLFRRGSDPMTVLKWKEIIDLLEAATNRAEDVANVIESVVLQHS